MPAARASRRVISVVISRSSVNVAVISARSSGGRADRAGSTSSASSAVWRASSTRRRCTSRLARRAPMSISWRSRSAASSSRSAARQSMWKRSPTSGAPATRTSMCPAAVARCAVLTQRLSPDDEPKTQKIVKSAQRNREPHSPASPLCAPSAREPRRPSIRDGEHAAALRHRIRSATSAVARNTRSPPLQ